jgi:hypothetical protein
MQTFLTSPSFQETAQHLDSLRLNKQRVECLQIYNSITGISQGWSNHPAVRMWEKHPALLCLYALKMSEECTRRGIKDNAGLEEKFFTWMNAHPFIVPEWWANADSQSRIIHTHRCNLLRKDYLHYRSVFPDVDSKEIFVTDYYWPVPTSTPAV